MTEDANLHIFSTRAALAEQVARYIADLSAQAVADHNRFTVALSGGSMPEILGTGLTAEPQRSQIDWPAWHVFWADERCVPLTHPDSNYRLAREQLFDYVDIPEAQIHTIDASLEPEAAAAAYQAELAQVFGPASGQPARFDLILLGMGGDGHTASLFPGHPLLNETERWVAPILDSPKPPPARITLTLPVINQAKNVAFIVTGQGKADVLAAVLETASPARPSSLPARLARPADGALHWFVDEAAAGRLGSRD